MYGVGSSQFAPKDTNVLLSSTLKQSDGEILKNKEFVNSDLYHHHHYNPYQQQQQSSGLMRYSSAPSTFFASLFDGGVDGCDDFVNNESSSSESETMFAKFMCGDSDSRDLAIKHEEAESVQQMMYQTQDMASHDSVSAHTNFSGSYNKVNSPMENLSKVKINGGNLMRQSSSPADLFSNLTVENGVAVMRKVGKFSVSNGNNGEVNPSTSRLSGHINFSSGQTGPSSCSRFMPQIPENGKASTETGSPENGHLGNSNCSNGYYAPGFPNDFWIDSTKTSLKRNREEDVKVFSTVHTFDTQNGDQRTSLTHHLSLPKTSAEMAAIEKYLQFQQDQVPCKIRAKRGFATHPRSIAERVRRTRISERMRKLQDLFPNIDKQANTAEMLDLAVEYIKDLQKQLKTLKDTQAKCTCSSKPKLLNPTG